MDKINERKNMLTNIEQQLAIPCPVFIQISKGRLQKKPSYLVTLSKKVGGGQDQITILGLLVIMTSFEGERGMKNHCHYFYGHFIVGIF